MLGKNTVPLCLRTRNWENTRKSSSLSLVLSYPIWNMGRRFPPGFLSFWGPVFLHSSSAAHCKAGSLELPWNLGHTGWNALLVFQQDPLPHRLPTYPAKRKPERLNPFIKGATLEKLGGCEALERQNQRQTLRKHFVKQEKNSIMLAIVLSTLQNVIDLEQERLCLFMSPCWKSRPRREVRQIPRQSVCQIIGIKMLHFPHLLNYLGASRKIFYPKILCGNAIVKKGSFSLPISLPFLSFLFLFSFLPPFPFTFPSFLPSSPFLVYNLISLRTSLWVPWSLTQICITSGDICARFYNLPRSITNLQPQKLILNFHLSFIRHHR